MQQPVYINFYSPINDASTNKLMENLAQIVVQLKPIAIHFLFASPGGSVDAGVALYNFLRALPVPISMHNTGAIDSIANVIFHAAEERFAAPHASFLFHGVTWGINQPTNLNHSQIRELESQVTASENKIASILSGRCKLDDAEIRNLFLNGETKDTSFALDKGIIQSILEPKIPAGAQFFSINCT